MPAASLPRQVRQGVRLRSPTLRGRDWAIDKLGLGVGRHGQGCGRRIKLARRRFGRSVGRESLGGPLEGSEFFTARCFKKLCRHGGCYPACVCVEG